MKKAVIGLRTQYLLPAAMASAVGLACLFLPLAESLSMVGILGAGWSRPMPP